MVIVFFKSVLLLNLICVNKTFLSEKSMAIWIGALPIHNTNYIWLLKPFAASWKMLKALLFSAFSSSLCILFYPVNPYLLQLRCTENSGLLKTYESTEDFSFKIFADNTWFVADSKAKLIFMALFFFYLSLFFFSFVLYFEIVKETN